MPKNNDQEAAVVKDLAVYGFQHLQEVVRFLDSPEKYQPVEVDTTVKLAQSDHSYCDLKDVKGQVHARRALEIAAAGSHNLNLIHSKLPIMPIKKKFHLVDMSTKKI